MTERTIFLEALEKDDPAERSAFLETACGGDVALRQRVESLLTSHDQAGNFPGKSAPERIAAELGLLPASDETQGELSRDSQAAEEDLGFLTPSAKAGVLGRVGHYDALEVIGKGGMGTVLRAFDDKLHRVVAIKIMAAQLATSAAARRRFMREAQAQAAVSHDHIVTIHAVEEANGLPYLVMQYVAGVSLQERLDKSGPLQLFEILRIGMQTASGLAAAHAQGLVHRDIKPANILLENGVERVKITDFGLARAATDASLTQSGVVAGTPHYMSPEQARGDSIDQRTDLFSLGSVLYAMCTGRAPFRASGSMAVLKRVCEETPTPIREANPEIPEWLVAIIDKLHAKEPAQRYQSAAEVAELLGRHLAHVQHPSVMPLPAAVPPASAERELLDGTEASGGSRPPLTRRRRWAVAAALLLVLIGGLSMTEATGVTNLRATVIRIVTGDGTLIVEVNDPGVKVTIEGDGGLVITGAGPHEVRLRPGSYKLQAAKDGKPLRLAQELVTITRGDKQVVRVAVEPKTPAEPGRPTFVTPWSDSDDWIVEGQELLQPDDSRAHLLLFGEPGWTDYSFEAEVKITVGASEVGLVFRAREPVNRLAAILGGFGNMRHGIMGLSKTGAGGVCLVSGKTEKGRWYRLRVEARGNSFKMFVDGEPLTSGRHDDYPRGCVGLVTNSARARFRNLKVTDPDGKVLLEGLQNVLPKAKNAAYSEPRAGLQNAVRQKPNDAKAHFALGSFHARWGEWKEAAAAFDRGLQLEPGNHSRWCHTALLHLLAGDDEGYSRVCREMIQRFGNTDDRLVAERTVKICLLRAGAVSDADFDRLQKLAAYAVSGPKDGFYHYYLGSKVFADYRAGRYAQAITALESLAPNPNGGPVDMERFAILAMAQHRLGQTAKAETALARATAIMAKMPDPAQGQVLTDWWGWGSLGSCAARPTNS